MGLSDAFLPEFDHEMQMTRRLLERIPDAKLEWKPHPKSMALGRLASHVAEMAQWSVSITDQDSFDLSPPGSPPSRPSSFKSREELLSRFDEYVRKARASLAAVTDMSWMRPWSLLKSGQSLFTMPKVVVFRTWVMSHLVHHRGQLTVYLRMNDVSLPSIYGPTADEGGM